MTIVTFFVIIVNIVTLINSFLVIIRSILEGNLGEFDHEINLKIAKSGLAMNEKKIKKRQA